MKVVRCIINFISTLMIVSLLVLTVLLVGVRVVGLTPYAVLSGSMEPTYHVGSLIYVKKIDPAEITVGTPITFVVNEDLLVATHRVIEVEARTSHFEQVKDEAGNLMYEEDGNPMLEEVMLDEPAYYFTTKGDANDVIDGSPVYYKNVIGSPVFSVPYLGYFSNWLQTRKGMIVAVSTVLILMILTFLPDLLRFVDDEPQKAPKKKAASGKKSDSRSRKRAAGHDAPEGQAQRKKSSNPLTDEERAFIIAGRKARGEEIRGRLTQEERAAIIARRRAARAAQQAQETFRPEYEEPAQQLYAPAAEAAEASGDEGENPVRRRRRRPAQGEEN